VAGRDVPRRRRDDVAEEAAQDDGVPVGEVAPAVGGGLAVLRPKTEVRGRLLVRRSGERRNVCGGGGQGIWLVGGGSVLMGRGGEGASEGWAPCGIGAGERERERGGP
jgi:hypothetical protein